jgi:hypothetical protein
MSFSHLLAPQVGAALLPISVASILVNNKPLTDQVSVSLSGLPVTGAVTQVIGSFIWDGVNNRGVPASIVAYQQVSGLGNKGIQLVAGNGTVYYSASGLTNPDGIVTLTQVVPLPALPIGLFVKSSNDSTGIITVSGLTIYF